MFIVDLEEELRGWSEGPVSRWPLSLTPVFFLFSIRDLLKFKEEVTKERDQLLSEVVKLRESLAQTTGQQQETERSKEEAEQVISQVRSAPQGKIKDCGGIPSAFPVSLPILFFPCAQMEHLLLCFFLWLIPVRTVLLESFFSPLPLSQKSGKQGFPA